MDSSFLLLILFAGLLVFMFLSSRRRMKKQKAELEQKARETVPGAEVLLHVGIDTVDLKGRGFQALVQQGESVRAGHPLLRIDTAVIRGAGYSSITPVIVLNNHNATVKFD